MQKCTQLFVLAAIATMLLSLAAILSVVLSAGRDLAREPPVRHATAVACATQVRGSCVHIARLRNRTHLLYVQRMRSLALASVLRMEGRCVH